MKAFLAILVLLVFAGFVSAGGYGAANVSSYVQTQSSCYVAPPAVRTEVRIREEVRVEKVQQVQQVQAYGYSSAAFSSSRSFSGFRGGVAAVNVGVGPRLGLRGGAIRSRVVIR